MRYFAYNLHLYHCFSCFLLDPNAAAVCDFNHKARSANVRGSYVQLQTATGCAVNSSQNNDKKYVAKFSPVFSYVVYNKCFVMWLWLIV